MNEKSWVSTYVDYNGFKITVTEMGGTAEEALASLIELLDGVDAKPFLDRNNVMSLEDKIEAAVPTAQMIEHGFPNEDLPSKSSQDCGLIPDGIPVKLDDGTNYLGVKKFMKAGDVKAGDSFDIYVSSFSFDGQDIKFYNDGEYPVASHKMTGDWLPQFEEIFNGWKPPIGENIAMPPRLLHIVCSGAKKTGNPYQNIKSVSDG